MKVPKQPEANIGMIGHVDHGKTTLTQCLTGTWTDVHSQEIKRGISIKLGYADAAFYKYPTLPDPQCYGTKAKGPGNEVGELLRTVSFVDAPGHETLMAIMLSGAAIMDGALLLVAANDKCPQPQTREHLQALEISGNKNIVIVQNKIDLVNETQAMKNYEEIQNFVDGTVAQDAPIIPVSAHHEVNIDALVAAIEQRIPTPKRDASTEPLMFAARSFDVNRPGTEPKKLTGGVVGGSLLQGTLKIGEEIEISPGNIIEERGQRRIESLVTTITALHKGGQSVESAGPGGLLAVGTLLDPVLTKSDSLAGKVVGRPGTLPPIWEAFTLDTHLLERVVGVDEDNKVDPIKTREPLMLTVGTATTVGTVASARANVVDLKLKLPVTAKPGQRVAISRRVENRWRLIGHGLIKN
jgi:translation initiation factor 2 subunit 3